MTGGAHFALLASRAGEPAQSRLKDRSAKPYSGAADRSLAHARASTTSTLGPFLIV